MATTHTCLVCGYPKLQDAPRSQKGGGSYEICPSCGFQFGVDDDDKSISYEQARKSWMEEGMPWSSKGKLKPARWNAQRQLEKFLNPPSLGLKAPRKRVRKTTPKN